MTLNLPLVEILSSNQTIKKTKKKVESWIFEWIWILGRQTEDNMEDIDSESDSVAGQSPILNKRKESLF